MRSEHLATGLAVALLATLALPVPAGAATARFKGPIAETDDGRITLVGDLNRGKVKHVTSFAVRDLPLECVGEEPETVSGQVPTLDLRVGADRRFGIGWDVLTFVGRFSRDYQRVRGQLEIDFRFTEEQANCGTARHRYFAAR
jgi:hypothetical protein